MVGDKPPVDTRQYYEVMYYGVRNDIHSTGSMLFKSTSKQLAELRCKALLQDDDYQVKYVSAHLAEMD